MNSQYMLNLSLDDINYLHYCMQAYKCSEFENRHFHSRIQEMLNKAVSELKKSIQYPAEKD